MLEVTKVTVRGKDYLKLKMVKFDRNILDIIKSIDGWFRSRESYTWGLPFDKLKELMAKTYDYMVIWKIDDTMGSLTSGINTDEVPTEYCVPYEPKLPMRDYQIQAFNLLMSNNVLLESDDPGLGKTFPMLCSIEAKKQLGIIRRSLYITKATLTYDVLNQTRKFTYLNASVVDGNAKKRAKFYSELPNTDIDLIITSYETFRQDAGYYVELQSKGYGFDLITLDEAHRIKSPTSQIGKAVHTLKAKYKYAVTATPVINELADLYNILKWLGVLNYNWWTFRNKFCVLNPFGAVSGYKHIGELKTVLQSVMLRRLKTQVLDLPPVSSMDIFVELTKEQAKVYEDVERFDGDFEKYNFEELDFDDIPTDLTRYARLAQIAESVEIVGGVGGTKGSAKLRALEELLEDIVARGEKAVVFSRSKRFTKIMAEYFKKYNPAEIHGDISSHAKVSEDTSARQKEIDRFQEDENCKVIFCCEAAAREGWTGTAANNVIFTSKPWSSAYVSQCIGRCWRFGQEGGSSNSVNVYSIIARGTVDERVEELLAEKQYLMSATVETPPSSNKLLEVLGGVNNVAV